MNVNLQSLTILIIDKHNTKMSIKMERNKNENVIILTNKTDQTNVTGLKINKLRVIRMNFNVHFGDQKKISTSR